MKSYALIFLSLLLLALEVGATNPLGAASKLSLARKGRLAANCATANSGKDGFQAFISVDDSLTVSSLRRLGIKVNAVFDEGTEAEFDVVREDGKIRRIDVGYDNYIVRFYPAE